MGIKDIQKAYADSLGYLVTTEEQDGDRIYETAAGNTVAISDEAAATLVLQNKIN